MKRLATQTTMMALGLAVIMSSLTACSNDDYQPSVSDNPAIMEKKTDITIVDQGVIKNEELVGDIVSGLQKENGGESETRSFISYDDILGRGELRQALFGYSYFWLADFTVWMDDGTPEEISAVIVAPHDDVIRNVIIGCHVTITANKQCPTENFKNSLDVDDVKMLATYAADGNLVIIPDYLGYGSSKHRAHSYLQQEMTAKQVATVARQTVNWLKGTGLPFDKNWNSVAVGYSQGGSVAMATHRYIEENDLVDELHFAGSVCGDGPYDPIATLDSYIKTGRIYMPVAAGLIIKGMLDYEPSLKGRYTPKDFFTQGYINTNVLNAIEHKDKTTSEIQEMMTEYAGKHTDFNMMRLPRFSWNGNADYENYVSGSTDALYWTPAAKPLNSYCTPDQVFRKDVLEYLKTGRTENSADQHKMMLVERALRLNVLTSGKWQPKHPVILFHSKRDEVVPYSNYESARRGINNEFFRGICYDSPDTYTHVGTGTAFYLDYCKKFYTSILNGNWRQMEKHSVNNSYIY